jgi:hypothetical protein
MSTGQPPSDNSSDGEKRSQSRQPREDIVVEGVSRVESVVDARGERALSPRDLLAPPLIEKTPRGIGPVTLGSLGSLPSRPSNPVAMESTTFVVTPIVPIVAAPSALPAESVMSIPPEPARELDDPDSWNVDATPAPAAIAGELAPPTTRSPSLQSELASVVSSEVGLSGEFFAAPDVTLPPPELRQSQDSDSFIDERQQRSISPEVVARRTRYRVLVVRVIVGFVLLLVAAIVLKVTRKH